MGMSAHLSSQPGFSARRLVMLFLIVCGVALALLAGYGFVLSTSLALPKSDEHPPLLIYGAPFFLTPGLHPVDEGLFDRLHRLEYPNGQRQTESRGLSILRRPTRLRFFCMRRKSIGFLPG
ncbi:MAG: hypothetical protein HC938_01420 [Nitrospira sp.]|nr:hypothetical protein [Nitrospira sp.]